MKTLAIELRKEKRTGVIPVLLAVGVLGAAYAFVNFLVRKDTLLNLPLAPMDVLLTQLYGMIMLPCIAAMWAITVLFEKPLLSVGLNLLLVIPGVLVANTPLWIVYPYCYSGYLVSCSLHDFTAETSDAAFSMFPFLPCAIVVFGLFFALAVTQFGKKEMR